MADIFVSYARADKARVAPLVAALEAKGWSVWWDPAIIPGQEFDDRIAEEIDKASAVVVVWTPASVTSRWVRGEAREAADRGILIPVRFENARLPIDARVMHTTDLDGWKEDAKSPVFQELLGALSRLVKSVPRAQDAERRTSICVLPFANMSDDAQQEYFSDGISEDIITDLSKVSALSVTSRNSAFSFKGKHVDMKQVASQLGVSHVLEGSVRKSGNRVRITAQLINAAEDSHIWAERYDRSLEDIFALQDEISQAIVAALKLKLFPEEKQAIEDRGTTNVEAYDLYLRARSFGITQSGPELKRAIDLYRRALKIDPNFAQAWAGLGTAIGSSFIFYPETIQTLRPEMDAAVVRATELAPDLPEIRSSRAVQAMMRYDWMAAEQELRKGLPVALDNGIHGFVLTTLGRALEGLDARLEERRLDPLSVSASFGLQLAFDITGRFEDAETEYERSRDLPGNRAALEWRAVTRLMARGDDHFKERLAFFISIDSSYQAFLPRLQAVLDQPEKAFAILRAAFDDPAYQDGARMGAIAHWAVHFGDLDFALAALRRGYVEKGGLTLVEIWHPIFAPIRKDPRFKAIVRDIGLADHWRATGKWGDFVRPLGDNDFEIIR
ncbi:MAG: TIR domain-containing protein [Alphaproteobacteria bacterium]